MIRWYGSVHVFNFEQNKLVRVSQQPTVPLVAGASTKQQNVVVPLAAFPNQLSKGFINSTNVQRNHLSPSLSLSLSLFDRRPKSKLKSTASRPGRQRAIGEPSFSLNHLNSGYTSLFYTMWDISLLFSLNPADFLFFNLKAHWPWIIDPTIGAGAVTILTTVLGTVDSRIIQMASSSSSLLSRHVAVIGAGAAGCKEITLDSA